MVSSGSAVHQTPGAHKKQCGKFCGLLVCARAGWLSPILVAYRHECGLSSLPAKPVDGRVVWQASWIERLRFGAKPIPPRSVVIDGHWRRDDSCPGCTTRSCVSGWCRSIRSEERRGGKEC